MERLETFVQEYAGDVISPPFPDATDLLVDMPVRLVSELAWIYRNMNGFYAFAGALHFYPLANIDSIQEVRRWNAPETWKKYYADFDDAIFCFAENLFGEQFCIVGGVVCRFDPETCEMEMLGNCLDEWCSSLLSDCEVQTGYPLVKEWLASHGPLPVGSRLVPNVPFVCGGEFSISNLHLSPVLDSMRFRASIFNQIRNVTNDGQIKFTVVENE